MGIGATLVPGWIGSALLSTQVFVPAILSFGVALLGSSLAFVYAGYRREGLLSGAGKLAMVGMAVAVEFNTSASGDTHHPYLLAMAVFAAMLWMLIDFARLFWLLRSKKPTAD